MALTPLTVTNAGADLGAGVTTGWTVELGGFTTRSSNPAPYSGERYFTAGASPSSIISQRLDLASQGVSTTDIDAGLVAVLLSVQCASFAENDPGSIGLRALDGSLSVLLEEIDEDHWVLPILTWKTRTARMLLPSGSRHLEIVLRSTRTAGTNNDSYWDDIAVSYGTVSDVFGSGSVYSLRNPGAEDGLWPLSVISGGIQVAESRSPAVGGTLTPFAGSRFFSGGKTEAFVAAEKIALVTGGVSASSIDAGEVDLLVSAMFACAEDPSGTTDEGELWVRFVDGAGSTLSTHAPTPTQLLNVWTEKSLQVPMPAGARYALVGVQGLKAQAVGLECSVYWDSYTVEAVPATSLPAAARRRQMYLMGDGCSASSWRSASGGGPEPETDPYWSNVVLLLRGEGTDGSQTVYDDATATNWKTSNQPAIDTDEARFGAGSLYSAGSGAFSTKTYQSAYNIGTGDFTVECWARSADVSTVRYIFMHPHTGGYTGGGWYFFQRASGAPAFRFADGSAEAAANGDDGSTPGYLSLNTWHHIAATVQVVGADRVIRLFIDGALIREVTTSLVPANGNTSEHLMQDRNSLSRGWNGHIDELRITVGVARYTAAFTPPTAAFPGT